LTIILMELSDQLPGDQILAVILVFRVIYFLVPLVTACALFSSLEARDELSWHFTLYGDASRLSRIGSQSRQFATASALPRLRFWQTLQRQNP